MLNECGQLWASRAAQALDVRLTNHVVDPSVNPALLRFGSEVEGELLNVKKWSVVDRMSENG